MVMIHTEMAAQYINRVDFKNLFSGNFLKGKAYIIFLTGNRSSISYTLNICQPFIQWSFIHSFIHQKFIEHLSGTKLCWVPGQERWMKPCSWACNLVGEKRKTYKGIIIRQWLGEGLFMHMGSQRIWGWYVQE